MKVRATKLYRANGAVGSIVFTVTHHGARSSMYSVRRDSFGGWSVAGRAIGNVAMGFPTLRRAYAFVLATARRECKVQADWGTVIYA